MITYTLDILYNNTPMWWQNFFDCKIEDAIEAYINIANRDGDSTREFIEYINEVLEQRYDAYYDIGTFGNPALLEFSTDEGHMLFIMEWA